MSGLAALPLVLAAAALVTATVALAAAVLSWRAADRQARMVAELGGRLRDLGDRIEIGQSTHAPPMPTAEIGALRDDLAILFEHVAALTSGQLDLKKIVSAAVARQVAPVLDRFDQADARADERNGGVHRRIELVQEQLTDLADDLAALATRTAAPAQEAPQPRPAAELAASFAEVTTPAVAHDDASGPAEPAAAPLLPGREPDMAPPEPEESRLEATVAEPERAAPPVGPASRRTPAVFDSGKVAMLLTARRKELA